MPPPSRHSNAAREEIARRAAAAFRADAEREPRTTLRGGNSLDGYEQPPAYDPVLDEPTDGYVETYASYGVVYLDPDSWRHYLPLLMDHALRNYDVRGQPGAGLAIGALLGSLRPPDRDPPRLATLTTAQERVIVALLDVLAFEEDSDWQDEAMELLEDYWAPAEVEQRAKATSGR
jgi:hypothetical protein